MCRPMRTTISLGITFSALKSAHLRRGSESTQLGQPSGTRVKLVLGTSSRLDLYHTVTDACSLPVVVHTVSVQRDQSAMLTILQARQKQMQLKAQRQAAEDQEESEYMRSLSAREAELSRLERGHHAAIKAHNAKIK